MDCDPRMIFPALLRAHHSAVHAGMTARGLRDVGSPRLLALLRQCRERGEAPSQRELADLLHVSPATIAVSLKSLERNGYVERRADPADSRRNLISLTPRALEALDASFAVFRAVDEAMLAGFSEEEIGLLVRLNLRCLKNLYQIGGKEDGCCPPPPFPCQAKEEP